MIPLDALDLRKVSILYSAGSMAAVTPIYDYNYNIIEYAPSLVDQTPAWRHLLQWLGLPGIALAAVMLLTVSDARAAPSTPWWQRGPLGRLLPLGGARSVGGGAGAGDVLAGGGGGGAGVLAMDAAGVMGVVEEKPSVMDTLKQLVGSPEFLVRARPIARLAVPDRR
jgi:hypothetical protein